MAKSIKKYTPREDLRLDKTEEPLAVYAINKISKRQAVVADFPYSKFHKIASRVPFTLKEWSNILHLSERTLQRYAKDDKSFEGIYVDRILQMKELIDMGLETFVSADAFVSWLKKEKQVLGNLLTFESLYSQQGIQLLIDQLGRIQYGVYT